MTSWQPETTAKGRAGNSSQSADELFYFKFAIFSLYV